MKSQLLRVLAMVVLLSCGANSHEKLRREVVLFGVNNQACNQWKRCEQPRFEADGWVVVTSNDPGDGPWPHFVIDQHGKQHCYEHYLFFKQINEVTR